MRSPDKDCIVALSALRRDVSAVRRLVIRWEYHADNFLGMVQLGCIKILLRHI